MRDVKVRVLTEGTKKAEKDIKKVDSSIKDTSASTNQLTGTLDKMSNGAVSGFKAFAAGLKTVALGFRTVGGAIAASGLGLLVITISALTAAFRGSEEGQNKFSRIMSVIGAVTGNLIDLLADLGDLIIGVFENPKESLNSFATLIKDNIVNRFEGLMELIPALGTAIGQLFDGEFAAAAETAGNAFGKVALGVEDVTGKIEGAIDASKDFVKQNIEEGKAAGKVADMRAKADKVERGLLVRRAKAENEIAELRLVAKDMVNATAEERKAALEKVLEIQDSLIGSEQEVADLRRDAQIMENGFARSTKENLEEEERLKAESIAVETRRLNQKRQIARELSATEMEILRDKEAAEKQAAADKKVRDDAEATRLKSISDYKKELIKKDEDNEAKTEEAKLELERTRAQEKLDAFVGTEEEKREAQIALNKVYDDKELELAKATEEKKREELKALNDKFKEDDLESKLADLELKKEEDLAELLRLEGTEEQKLALIKHYAELSGKLVKSADDDATKKKMENQDAVFAKIAYGIKRTQDLSNAGFQLAEALGKQDEKSKEKRARAAFAVNKVMMLATASMDATKGVMKAFSETTDFTPTQSLRTANAVIAGVVGAGNIASIAAQKFEGGGRGASNIPSPAAEVNQSPAFNLVEGTEGSSIQNSIQNKSSQPIKAYVVSGEVQSQASLDRSIQDSSSI
tara:strand:- start:214 stop:2292 length:2079 start_codon:yes stop_codon:yes gene_type:complete